MKTMEIFKLLIPSKNQDSFKHKSGKKLSSRMAKTWRHECGPVFMAREQLITNDSWIQLSRFQLIGYINRIFQEKSSNGLLRAAHPEMEEIPVKG